MLITGKKYDALKWAALMGIPTIEGLWVTLAYVWGWPYLEPVAVTIAALGVAMAGFIGVSNIQYARQSRDPVMVEDPGDDETDTA
jgi:hypothetical protein